MAAWIISADEQMDAVPPLPFCVDLVIHAEGVMLRWGIPLGLSTTVSAASEAYAVHLTKTDLDTPAAEQYEWIRSKAREMDAWNRKVQAGILLRKLVEAMGGAPKDIRSGRRRVLYPGSMHRGIEFHYACADFPKGTASLTRPDEAHLAGQVCFCETGCSSLLLECCHAVRVHDARVTLSALDLPGGTTTFPHASKRAAEEVAEEIRAKVQRLNGTRGSKDAPSPPKYEPSSPKYAPPPGEDTP